MFNEKAHAGNLIAVTLLEVSTHVSKKNENSEVKTLHNCQKKLCFMFTHQQNPLRFNQYTHRRIEVKKI